MDESDSTLHQAGSHAIAVIAATQNTSSYPGVPVADTGRIREDAPLEVPPRCGRSSGT
jgi:hypothetical protein